MAKTKQPKLKLDSKECRDLRSTVERLTIDRDAAHAAQVRLHYAHGAALQELNARNHRISELLDANARLTQQNAQLNSNLATFRDRFMAHQIEMKMEARFWNLDIHKIIDN